MGKSKYSSRSPRENDKKSKISQSHLSYENEWKHEKRVPYEEELERIKNEQKYDPQLNLNYDLFQNHFYSLHSSNYNFE